MQAAEPRALRIKELTELVTSKRTELKAAEKAIAAEVEELKMSIQRHRVERDREAASIDDVLLQRYDMIFRRRAGLAVPVAKVRTCHGGRMRLPPQLFNQIQKQVPVTLCPNYHPILLYE